jgi:UDPglucose--hexose-1-phosphate uridylyltransferase
MPELRKDPIIGRWVIIATERQKRPVAFPKAVEKSKGGFCPFCPGNESYTPPEVLSYRPAGSAKDQAGWWVRVVPNKFPALKIEGEPNRVGEGMFDKMNGIGAHEVVIETPNHDLSIADMSEKEVEEIIWAFRDRTIELRKDKRFRYILIFKNQGRGAGATLDHPHSQIIALPIVPKRVTEEMAGAEKYYEYKERCVFCDIIRQERKDHLRIIEENDTFVAFIPFASRFPYEACIIPKSHESYFNDIQKNGAADLAKVLRNVLKQYKEVLGDPDYNFIIHTTPFENGPLSYYHWHLEAIPRLTTVAGFEWGTGFFINPVPPEDAAAELRQYVAKPYTQKAQEPVAQNQ